jgi:uncharacterized sporulation protein YeaH/YhbH (DUF444 family)
MAAAGDIAGIAACPPVLAKTRQFQSGTAPALPLETPKEVAVRSLEERLAVSERRIEEQRVRTDDVREAVRAVEARIDRLEFRLDQRFAGIDQRFLGIETRLDSMTRMMWALLIAVVTSAVATLGGIVTAVMQN